MSTSSHTATRRSATRCLLLLATLWTATLVSGCGKAKEPAAPAAAAHDHAHDHGHDRKAPHGGTLAVLGEEAAHLELLLEPATGKLNVYVLDSSAKGGVRLKQRELTLAVTLGETTHSLTLAAQAFGLTGETPDESSHFAGTFPVLVGATQFGVRLPELKVKGVDFSGLAFNFPEGNEAAAHAGHDH